MLLIMMSLIQMMSKAHYVLFDWRLFYERIFKEIWK